MTRTTSKPSKLNLPRHTNRRTFDPRRQVSRAPGPHAQTAALCSRVSSFASTRSTYTERRSLEPSGSEPEAWAIHGREVRGMFIQPGPVRVAVVLLECCISMWMTVQQKWMEVIAQQLYEPNRIEGGWYKYQRSQKLPRENTPNHD
ncbi:hypothetical protein AVEN_243356-1 [Araneus ventricosus]|uniref:Uncharacterized protein n=1 Tax=Araneus ventricosus TaxID=182803 RepID=A0A4Y2UF95_ARAVE|nr:hypothetical protein AVEN_243356-1 [Araneus ventricosus]